jgi:CDP-4-dehydro-6-deoxyglucose reductase, E1
MLAHALGNPFNLKKVLEFCKRHDLWLVEDNCDALGCEYFLDNDQLSFNPKHHGHPGLKHTGSFGHISTQSFYPPHHMTMGEGGSVNIISDMTLKICAESFRDWGRDCWCPSGIDNTCKKRYGWQLGELPEGYDHKYVYSHLGYNLKPLDVQAAIGRAQIEKLPSFVEARKRNWETLRKGLAHLEEFFQFTLPTHATGWTPEGFTWDDSGCRTECSWFAFLLQVRAEAPFNSRNLARYLEEMKIGNRMFFGGNLVKQPAFVQLQKDRPQAFRVVGELKNADRLMESGLFLGTYPGLTESMIGTMVKVIQGFVGKY